jgi:hypothetical protein
MGDGDTSELCQCLLAWWNHGEQEAEQVNAGNAARQAAAQLVANLMTNGAIGRIDQRARSGAELRQWGLHPHKPDAKSPLAADDVAFERAYPEALSGGQGVTEEALFPMRARQSASVRSRLW